MKTEVMTPNWSDILPGLLGTIENGGFDSRNAAEMELERMAHLADLYVMAVQKGLLPADRTALDEAIAARRF